MKTWVLAKGAGARFRSGHPWVFSNELELSPKGTPPGELIQLVDFTGTYLATGYGNPQSLIAFRTLSRGRDEFPDAGFFLSRFREAQNLRHLAGLLGASHRLVFAESDFLPGLIIDRYLTEAAQVFVLQISTAGMDRLKEEILEGLRLFVEWEKTNRDWARTSIVMANTSASRKLEGLKIEEKQVVKSLQGLNLSQVKGLFQSAANPAQNIELSFDILGGQKTGFFLDQRDNIRRLMEMLLPSLAGRKRLRVLDLCPYVGHWSSQVAAAARDCGLKAECLLYDASEDALKFATANVGSNGGVAQTIRGDVLEPLRMVAEREFDLVICDPPAFIKKKKDVPTGRAAYLKLFKEAQKRVAPGGILVCCSCSGLFEFEEFRQTLSKISHGPRHHIQWVKQGFHSPDHPQRLEFPEGAYLKCLIGVLTESPVAENSQR